MKRDELLDLAARAEAATGADRVLDWQVYAASKGIAWGATEEAWIRDNGRAAVPYGLPAYTASLDAALTLVGDRMWRCGNDGKGADPGAYLAEVLGMYVTHRCVAATPALALTAAALRARAEEVADAE